MRIASRHMPKYKAKSRKAAWLFLAMLVSCMAYVAFAEPVVVLVGAALIGAALLYARGEIKRDAHLLRALAEVRHGESICEFARNFDPRTVDTWIVRAVYEQLQDQLKSRHPRFPLRASDRLKQDLLLDDDDLDLDIAEMVEQRTGRSLERIEENPLFGKVETARDLVLFFNAQPMRSAA
jgi:hypothetical protein